MIQAVGDLSGCANEAYRIQPSRQDNDKSLARHDHYGNEEVPHPPHRGVRARYRHRCIHLHLLGARGPPGVDIRIQGLV